MENGNYRHLVGRNSICIYNMGNLCSFEIISFSFYQKKVSYTCYEIFYFVLFCFSTFIFCFVFQLFVFCFVFQLFVFYVRLFCFDLHFFKQGLRRSRRDSIRTNRGDGRRCLGKMRRHVTLEVKVSQLIALLQLEK